MEQSVTAVPCLDCSHSAHDGRCSWWNSSQEEYCYCDNSAYTIDMLKHDLKVIKKQHAAELEQLRMAVGLATTLHPTVQVSPDKPLEMMQEIVQYVTATIEDLQDDIARLDSWPEDGDR